MTHTASMLEVNSAVEQPVSNEEAGLRRHLFVRRLHLESYLGLCAWERVSTQPITIDLEYALAESAAKAGRGSAETSEIVNHLRAFALEGHYDLVEALAEGIAAMLFARFDISWLLLTVTKRRTFPSTEVGFTIERSSPRC